MSILDMSASKLAALIKSGQVTSEEATRSYINHIRKVNPIINVLVEERFEEALQEARIL